MVLAALCLCFLQKSLQPIAKVATPMIDELSGIAKSRQYKNTYWVHNDSGDSARIFAIHPDGTLIQPNQPSYEGIKLEGATNFDWEDIAIEGKTLYVSDCGDNLNFRKDQCVYVLPEPDPTKVTSVANVKKIRIAYPDKTPTSEWRYDCESLMVSKGRLYFITKWRKNQKKKSPDTGASIYSLEKPSYSGVNTLKKLDTKTDLGGWVTAADISPDGKRLALLTQAPEQSVWLFDMTKGGDIFHHPIKQIKFTNAKQCEALCWDSPTSLIIANEQSELFRVDLQ
ncbi:MAG: hypothetical protein GC165_02625 [Armatimonadetes bacterium]|nr:hypothetical protein [Armatimonadota bacterium]